MDFTALYDRIGPCGVILIVIGFFAIFITLYSFVYTSIVWRQFKKEFLDEKIAQNRCLNAYQGKNPFLVMIYEIVSTHSKHSDDIRTEVGYLFYSGFNGVLSMISMLKLISVVSPLLGLLGTVLGMLSIFDVIAQASGPSPTLLAAGIWQALITTVMGLCVAIPALIFYVLLSLRMKAFHIESIEQCYRVLEIHKNLMKKMNSEEACKSQNLEEKQ